MGLFNFSKKNPTPIIKDMVWINQAAKLNGCYALLQQMQDFVVIAWFSNTVDDFSQFLKEQKGLNLEIHLARSASSFQVANKKLILLEHYPLRTKELDLITNLNPSQVIVLNSLDEPLFEQFGGERLTQVIKSLGLKDDEMLEHSMITKSIEQAQKKLEQKISFENSANSAKEWFERNTTS